LYVLICSGIGCGRKEFPGVYTRVSNYNKWIESQGCFDPDEFYDKNADSDNYFGIFQLPQLPTWHWPWKKTVWNETLA